MRPQNTRGCNYSLNENKNMEKKDLKTKLENLQKLINYSDTLLDYCSERTKPYFTNGLINEINHCMKDIKSLNEEVKRGNLTTEMASIDMNHWMNENNWCTAKKLFDATNYKEGESAHQKLQDTLRKLQEELAGLHKSIMNAPVECYQQFYELCRVEDGATLADTHFVGFQAACSMYKEDLLRSLLHYKQYIIYEFFKRRFLRYDHCPLYSPHGRKFNFDFDLLSDKAQDNQDTKNFCLCLNRYLIIPDNYTINLNKELFGKYLFDNYLSLTVFDLIGLYYLERALELYNQQIEEGGFLDMEPNNLLLQPSAMKVWEKLQKEGLMDENLQPTGKVSNIQLAIIVELFCSILDIKTTWKPFEELWGLKNLRTYYNKIQYTDFYEDFRKNMRDLLAA